MHALIVGGGGTGAACAYDLSMRGFQVTLVERGELTSGTTGRHHGQLHSGARYAVNDPEIGRECMEEVRILGKIAAESMEMNYGLFLALADEDIAYGKRFEDACREADIPVRKLSTSEALRYEPRINDRALCAYLVPDGTLDAYRLPLQFFAGAMAHGARIRRYTRLDKIEAHNGKVEAANVTDLESGHEERLKVDVIVNAGGAWAGQIAARAGLDIPITPSPGTMVSVKGRLCNMVVSHLHPPGDGDIIVPQRKLSTIGSTQWLAEDPDRIATPEEDIRWLRERAVDLIPDFANAEFHAAWTAARPLAGKGSGDADVRGLSRDFLVVDHGKDGVAGMFSVIGGKATVLRAMAEKTCDAVCASVGVEAECRTADKVLPSHRRFFWGGRQHHKEQGA